MKDFLMYFVHLEAFFTIIFIFLSKTKAHSIVKDSDNASLVASSMPSARRYLRCLERESHGLSNDLQYYLDDIANSITTLVLENENRNRWIEKLVFLDDQLHLEEFDFRKIELKKRLILSQVLENCLDKMRAFLDCDFISIIQLAINSLKNKWELSTEETSRSNSDQKWERNLSENVSAISYQDIASWLNSHSVTRTFVGPFDHWQSVIDSFVSSFSEAVASSESIKRLFQFQLSYEDITDDLYRVFLDDLNDLNVTSVASNIGLMQHAFSNTLQIITPEQLLSAIARTAIKYLLTYVPILIEDVSKHAKEYVSFLDSAAGIVENDLSAETYMKALGIANKLFFSNFNLFTDDTMLDYAIIFTEELHSVIDEENLTFVDDLGVNNDQFLKTLGPETRNMNTRSLTKDINSNTPFSNFSSSLFKDIESSDVLLKLFTLDLNPEEVASEFYGIVYESISAYGAPNPDKVAEILTEAFESTSKQLNHVSYAIPVANSVMKFLTNHLVLTPDNSEELAHLYFKALLRAAVELSPSAPPVSFISALIKGTENFLIQQLLWNIDNVNSFSSVLFNVSKSSSDSDYATEIPTKVGLKHPISALLWSTAPVVFSSKGLSSSEATHRIQNFMKDIIESILANDNIFISFKRKFLMTASDIYSENLELDSRSILIETLFETISALLTVIINSNIAPIHEHEIVPSNLYVAKELLGKLNTSTSEIVM